MSTNVLAARLLAFISGWRGPDGPLTDDQREWFSWLGPEVNAVLPHEESAAVEWMRGAGVFNQRPCLVYLTHPACVVRGQLDAHEPSPLAQGGDARGAAACERAEGDPVFGAALHELRQVLDRLLRDVHPAPRLLSAARPPWFRSP